MSETLNPVRPKVRRSLIFKGALSSSWAPRAQPLLAANPALITPAADFFMKDLRPKRDFRFIIPPQFYNPLFYPHNFVLSCNNAYKVKMGTVTFYKGCK
jgi:hypothetical protein